jgi:mono/diheme cytochrome c family protein
MRPTPGLRVFLDPSVHYRIEHMTVHSTPMNKNRLAPSLVVTILLAACGGADQSTSSSTPKGAALAADAPGAKEATELFQSLCSTCHGTTGHGDGPGAAALTPKPRSFSDPAWQDSVTDQHIQKTIVFGGAAVGKSAMMPAQPQLKTKPQVLEALTKIVRSFRGK